MSAFSNEAVLESRLCRWFCTPDSRPATSGSTPHVMNLMRDASISVSKSSTDIFGDCMVFLRLASSLRSGSVSTGWPCNILCCFLLQRVESPSFFLTAEVYCWWCLQCHIFPSRILNTVITVWHKVNAETEPNYTACADFPTGIVVSDIAIFVLKRDVKLHPTNQPPA